MLACMLLGTGLCHTEQLKGVLYFDELGNGRYPSGTTKLAVGTTIYALEYGDPRQRHFQTEACYHLGAVWSVTVDTVDGSPYIRRASCSGEVDDDVHGPWLLVRNYLAGLPRSVSAGRFVSDRWRSSSEYRQFSDQLGSGELRIRFRPAAGTRCIDILSVERVKRTTLTATCSVELAGKEAYLVFDVVRSSRRRNWEIDEIKIVDPQEYWRIKDQRDKND